MAAPPAGGHFVSCWVAIDAVDAKNGAMQMVPGSHEAPLDTEPTAAKGNLLGAHMAGRESVVAGSPGAVDVELDAGACVFFHPMMAHRGPPNRSTRRRCGITHLFAPAEAWSDEAIADRDRKLSVHRGQSKSKL